MVSAFVALFSWNNRWELMSSAPQVERQRATCFVLSFSYIYVVFLYRGLMEVCNLFFQLKSQGNSSVSMQGISQFYLPEQNNRWRLIALQRWEVSRWVVWHFLDLIRKGKGKNHNICWRRAAPFLFVSLRVITIVTISLGKFWSKDVGSRCDEFLYNFLNNLEIKWR